MYIAPAEMLHLKRLAVWLFETAAEALLVTLLLVLLSLRDYVPGQNGLVANEVLLLFTAVIGVFMFGTGYLLTTAILRVVWGASRLWLFSAVAAALFVTHLQIFFFVARTGLPLSVRLGIRTGGACIVFACTFVGGLFLRKWVQTSSNQADALSGV